MDQRQKIGLDEPRELMVLIQDVYEQVVLAKWKSGLFGDAL
jgi:sRNA-binding carbon storage regulator CsrA